MLLACKILEGTFEYHNDSFIHGNLNKELYNSCLHLQCKLIIDKIVSNIPLTNVRIKFGNQSKTLNVYGIVGNRIIIYDGLYIGFWYIDIYICPKLFITSNIYESLSYIRSENVNNNCARCYEFLELSNYSIELEYYCDHCSIKICQFKYNLIDKYKIVKSLLISDISISIIKLIIDLYQFDYNILYMIKY